VVQAEIEPAVTMVIPAYNEAGVIAAKLENALAIDYPREQLEIIVGSDGSTDGTEGEASRFRHRGVRVVSFPARRGKLHVLNDLVRQATGEIVVLTDSSGMLDRAALRKLVRNFADPTVGCVTGRYRFTHGALSPREQGERLYFAWEGSLRRNESRCGSTLGAHGALYALRRHLYPRVPPDVINDDFLIPMRITEQGYRTLYEPEAVVYETGRISGHGEFARRVRIAVGNLQQAFLLVPMLHPRHGLVALQFLSRKWIRGVLQVPLLVILLVSSALAEGAVYTGALLTQLIFYLSGAIGFVVQDHAIGRRILSVPFYFVMGNLAYLMGAWRYLTGAREVRWEQVR
jgi:cellulose synthase/poly-beta-1,6-N-acetylglucosamine synthase-like glycosyltransferase